jgi:hypothetical protein
MESRVYKQTGGNLSDLRFLETDLVVLGGAV